MGKTATEIREKKEVKVTFNNIDVHPKAKSRVRVHRMRKRRKRVALKVIILLFLFVIITFTIWDLRTSRFEAWLFSDIASRFSYWMEPGPSNAIFFPYTGPYDKRLGYSNIQDYVDNLIENGYNVESQARVSPAMIEANKRGIFTIYREKTQGGLQIFDRDNKLITSSLYPQLVYPNLESIPKIIVDTLLYIENRELLDEKYPYRNPAVEWDRFAKAILDMGIHKIYKKHKAVGGSTMATQLEKYRHSPDGRTSEGKEKIKQMLSASLRTYQNGEMTMEARKQLIVDYINSVPLAACPGFGEVNGLGDGLLTWYNADFDEVNRLLSSDPKLLSQEEIKKAGIAYRQVLSLFIAHRRPSYYLAESPDDLKKLTDQHLKLLYNNGVIPLAIKNSAINAEIQIRRKMPPQEEKNQFVERKAENTIRTHLISSLGANDLYSLNRLDLVVHSTIDNQLQKEVTNFFLQLNDPEFASSVGMVGYRLLGEKVSGITYSFTLYENVDGANLLRIQADNHNQPLNINEGVKLELGSTSKLRTLVTYLEIIAELHKKYSGMSIDELRQVDVPKADKLSEWVISYLCTASDKSLKAIIDAAMERRYSGNPGERFFTGGGSHTFVNFESWENSKNATVTEALQDSINLSFIRIMRDIVNYYTYQVPGSTARILEDPTNPLNKETKQQYLKRFADKEGQIFLRRFYLKYKGKMPNEMLNMLVNDVNLVPARLAVVFRSVKPDASLAEFSAFMKTQLERSIDEDDIKSLYNKYSKSSYNLADRGYIARVHPLELWAVEYLMHNPEADYQELAKESAEERQAVYSWLFKTNREHAKDLRIKSLIEVEAFQEIHKSWQRLGYPFDYLTPSLATAIGVSGDRPAALAELMGIIQNNGVRYPSVKMNELHFAKGTPYETNMIVDKNAGEQVIAPEIAQAVRKALINVVENGTARRLNKVFMTKDGTVVPVGGKTGTGDNRRDVYSAKGSIIKSEIKSRTATFVFLIGDRFFGTATVYVAGDHAGEYKFTSSLPVQLLKVLSPKLMPMILPGPKFIRYVPAKIAEKKSQTEQNSDIAEIPINVKPPVIPPTEAKPTLKPAEKQLEGLVDETEEVIEYSVKLGTFSSKENATELANKVKTSGYRPRIVTEKTDGNTLHHVYIGRFSNDEKAKEFGETLMQKSPNVKEYLIKKVPKANPKKP